MVDQAVVTASEQRVRERLGRVAWWLDERWRIPFTPIRFGLDAVLGLVPFLGDAVGGLLSLWVVAQAMALQVPRPLLIKMLSNVAVELAVGAVPFLGDVFDVYWKANRRNLRTLSQYLDARHQPLPTRRPYGWWLFLGILAIVCLWLGWLALRSLLPPNGV